MSQVRKAVSSEGRRPLTARSVLASALLGSDPPELPVSQLVRVAELFGINENSARVALSRMVGAEEVEPIDGRYRLVGRLATRAQRQNVSRRPRLRAWRGDWVVFVVTTPRRAATQRSAARAALTQARLAELREGVWTRPDNIDVDLPPTIDTTGLLFRSAAPATPVPMLWDLEAWARTADTLRRELHELAPALDRGDAAVLAPGFVTSAAVLRHLQADPLLPTELLPRSWPGDLLRAEYESWDARYRRVLAGWHRAAERQAGTA